MPSIECIHCREEIKSGARRCPHCGSWQSRWFADAKDPRYQILLVAIILVPLAVVLYLPFRNLFSKPEFTVHQTSLVITDSEIQTFEQDRRTYVVVLGHIENRSPYPWGHFRFHVELFDAGQKLIDAFSEDVYDLVILPDSRSSFRVTGLATRKPREYAGHKATIRWATATSGFF